MRLAAADINAGAEATATPTAGGNLTLSIVEVATGTRAIEGLCDALASVGGNGTFGVGSSTSKIVVGVIILVTIYFAAFQTTYIVLGFRPVPLLLVRWLDLQCARTG